MIEYFLLIFAIVAFGLFCDFRGWTFGWKICYCVVCGGLICAVMYFRMYTGWDTNAYYSIYKNTVGSSLQSLQKSATEKGFLLLYRGFSEVSTLKVTGGKITSVVVSLLVTIQIYKYCKNPMIGFAGFVCSGGMFMAMNYQRQIIAMCIIGFSFVYIKRKEIFKFTLLVLLATTFHYSSLVVLPCYFVFQIPISKITTGVYAFATVGIFLVSDKIFKVAMYFIGILRFGKVYENGVDSYVFGAEMAGGVPFKYLFLLLFLAIAVGIFAERIKNKNEYATPLIHFLFVALFFEIIGVKHAYISRFAITFTFPAFLILSCETCEILQERLAGRLKISINKSKYVIFAVTIALYIIMMTIMIKGCYNGCYPYMTVADWR